MKEMYSKPYLIKSIYSATKLTQQSKFFLHFTKTDQIHTFNSKFCEEICSLTEQGIHIMADNLFFL